MKLWEPGEGIVLREVWRHKVYSIFPVRVVQDSPAWTVLCLPRLAIALYPHTREGIPIRIPEEEWIVEAEPWMGGNVLYLVHAGFCYKYGCSWDEDHIFQGWKIDLVEPIRRTSLGFDYLDQLLDIIVSADRTAWYWKDEDEVREAQARGLFTAEQVSDLYRRGERALQTLLRNEPPFDRTWETWRPDPAWLASFDLPQGWEQV